MNANEASSRIARSILLLTAIPILTICAACMIMVDLVFFLAGFPGWINGKLDEAYREDPINKHLTK